MWPFFKQKKQNSTYPGVASLRHEPIPEPRRALTLEQLVDGIGDCSDLGENDIALKFWLPSPAMQGMKEVSDIYDRTVSRLIRDFLLAHCYGMYAFEWMRENKVFRSTEHIMFSRTSEELPKGKVRVSTYFVPELGKNIAPMKLWIPSRLKNDLTILADHVDLTVSNYVREIAISRLLGHGTLPMRPKMLKFAPTPIAEDWNEDKDVPWLEVSEEEFSKYQYEACEVKSEIVDNPE